MWESKIVRHSKESPSSLTGNPLNFRTHPKKQREAVGDSIAEVGFIKSILVNEQTGYVIDGHERLWQALLIEEANPKFTIDVEWVSLSPEKEKLALTVLDATCEMAGVDQVMLDQILREVETGSEALADLIASLVDDIEDDDQEPESEEVTAVDGSVIQITAGDKVEMTREGNLIQMILPTSTINKVLGLIIEHHGGFNGK